MDADHPKIVVEVPRDMSHPFPAHFPKTRPKREIFKERWLEVITPADNLGDLIFDSLWTISLSSFITSTALFFPIPKFLQTIGWIFIVIMLFFVWQILRDIPESRGLISFRLSLVAIGVLLGL